jgi:hypothetical protein
VMTNNPGRLTAYHEAGHAVVAVHYNLPIERVSIVEDDESRWHVASRSPLRPLQQYRSNPMRIERGLRRRCQFCVAAVEAVRLIAPRLALDGAPGDYATAAETRDLIAHYRLAIEALVAAGAEDTHR